MATIKTTDARVGALIDVAVAFGKLLTNEKEKKAFLPTILLLVKMDKEGSEGYSPMMLKRRNELILKHLYNKILRINFFGDFFQFLP